MQVIEEEINDKYISDNINFYEIINYFRKKENF